MALEGLAGGVTREAMSVTLLGRAPGILDDSSDDFSLFEDAVRDAAAEVVPIVGFDPQDGPRRDLAVRAVKLCAAADIEEALFPEQNVGDTGRATFLRNSYDRVRAQLEAMPDDGPDEGETPAVGPRGSFPSARPYPDPVDGGGASWTPGFRRITGGW